MNVIDGNMTLNLCLALLIGILYPLFCVLTYKEFDEKLLKYPDNKARVYRELIAIFWLLTLLIFLNFTLNTENSVPLGLSFNWNLFELIGVAVSLLLVFLLFGRLTVNENNAAEIKEGMKAVFHFLPSNNTDFKWFSALAVSAGFCEEVIFRGFLFGFLNQYLNVFLAIILANLAFAICHIGTEKSNIIRSFILGMFFSASYYVTESLWVAIILHTAIDIYSGLLAYKANRISQQSAG